MTQVKHGLNVAEVRYDVVTAWHDVAEVYMMMWQSSDMMW